MNLTPSTPRLSACLVTLSLTVAAQAGLIHRYSFNDGAAKDSVGHVDGKLMGAGARIAGGRLLLLNDVGGARDKESYLEFAGSVLPAKGSVSLAVWFTARDIGSFARVINFGASEGSEGVQFIYFSPHIEDGSSRAAITGSDVSSKTNQDFMALDDGQPHLVAIVIDGTAKKLRVFVDGKEPNPAVDLGENTLDKVKPVQNWLGRSSFSADPALSATIDELRVYDHALSADEAGAIYRGGADKLPPAASTK